MNYSFAHQRSIQCAWHILYVFSFWLLLCLPCVAQEIPSGTLAFISVSELSPQARNTLHLIKQGGPFPYPRDGAVFSNYEHRLPRQPRGYYHEYTVRTPGARNRGPRRIVCGAVVECYYSGDHYRTFQRIEK